MVSGPVVYQNNPQVIAERAERYFAAVESDSVDAWLFFTDKGVFDRATFAACAQSVALTERAQHRRAKVGRDHVVFADMPVLHDYVSAVKALGGRLRVTSRWLNAASFRLAKTDLPRVAALPCVAEIEPVAVFHRPAEQTAPPSTVQDTSEKASLSTTAIDYGDAQYQLEQLNVPPLHEKGYSGAGVTLTIIDTGFRKTHHAFAQHFADGRVLAEYDFVNNDGNTDNEGSDPVAQRLHGTSVWSLAGGRDDGVFYGPAYDANFILCKTEDVSDEYQQEEDNWVAAVEYADSIGTDVIETSLGYTAWYEYSDYDGHTAVMSIAAGTCDSLGIVLVNSMGNYGPADSTLSPPSDAFGVLSVGAVDIHGYIWSQSSRGPTADGRLKPDVCARGSGTYFAQGYDDDTYGQGYGTSYASPLVAGIACLLIEAHPDWTPSQVREAIRLSGDNYEAPNNTYGWGVPDAALADSLTPECCLGVVGDANGDGRDLPTIGDVSTLIDYLYITQIPPVCYGEADVDLSGSLRPTLGDIALSDVMELVEHMFVLDTPPPDCLAR